MAALGGSASFLTPYGYTTNLMVQNLGGYTRADSALWVAGIVLLLAVLALLLRYFPLMCWLLNPGLFTSAHGAGVNPGTQALTRCGVANH